MENAAADGSRIPRSSVEAYLVSEDYQKVINERTSFCGVTHKDRTVKGENQDLIGPNDAVLVNKNYIGYISKIFTKPQDGFCYAFVELFDETLFSGEVRENITNLKGLIASKVVLPVSVVIQAMWSTSNVAESIIRIRGVDFTLDPSFEGSTFLKCMSSVEVPTDAGIIKAFSTNPESASRVATKIFSHSTTSAEVVEALPSEIPDISQEPITIESLFEEELTPDKLETLEAYYVEHPDELQSILDQIDLKDPNYREIVASSIRNSFKSVEGQKVFSTTISSVRDRVLMTKFPKHSLIQKMYRSYKYYYKVISKSINERDKKSFCRLVISDINMLLKLVSEDVLKGKLLSQAYSLGQFGQDFQKLGGKLSRLYRQVLISERVVGFVPRNVYVEFKKALTEFYRLSLEYIMDEPSTENPEMIDALIALSDVSGISELSLEKDFGDMNSITKADRNKPYTTL
jgi:hypothetical protein